MILCPRGPRSRRSRGTLYVRNVRGDAATRPTRNLRHTAAGGANYFFDDGKAAPGDRVRIVNDGGGDVALFLLTLDGFSTTNRVRPGATIDIVKVASGTNEWRTLGSYGSVTQA